MEAVGFTSDVVESVRDVVTSDAWERFFVPSLEAIRNSWRDELMDPSEKRKSEHPDDYIRGCVATINALLDLPAALIEEAATLAAQRQAREAQEEHFLHRADLGTP